MITLYDYDLVTGRLLGQVTVTGDQVAGDDEIMRRRVLAMTGPAEAAAGRLDGWSNGRVMYTSSAVAPQPPAWLRREAPMGDAKRPAVRGLDWDPAEYILRWSPAEEKLHPRGVHGKWAKKIAGAGGDPAKLAGVLAEAHTAGAGHDVVHAVSSALETAKGHHGAVSHPTTAAATTSEAAGLGPSALHNRDQLTDFAASLNASALLADLNSDWVPPRPGGWTPDMPAPKGVKAITSAGRPPPAKGTPDDPIDVRGDLDRALQEMRAGHSVRLNQVAEVATMLHRIEALSKKTLADEKKPDWDFGLLTVRGTDLFTAKSQGIPRAEMPQFGGLAQEGSPAAKLAGGAGKFVDLTPQLKAKLAKDGVKITEERVPVAQLRATQTQLSGAKVAGFASAAISKNPDTLAKLNEPIFVTRDNYVIDGHHRWAGNMMLDALDGTLGNDTYQNVIKIDMDIGAAIPYANEFAQNMGIGSRALGRWSPLELRDKFGKWALGGNKNTPFTRKTGQDRAHAMTVADPGSASAAQLRESIARVEAERRTVKDEPQRAADLDRMLARMRAALARKQQGLAGPAIRAAFEDDADAWAAGEEEYVAALVADADQPAGDEQDDEAARFNMNHAPPGPGGGQFTSGGGGQGNTAAKKRELRQRAKTLRARAHNLVLQLHSLQQQLKTTAASHRHSARKAVTSAKAAKKAAGTAHKTRLHKQTAHHRRAAASHKSTAVTLHGRIAALRGRIRRLYAEAKQLDRRAARM